MKSKKYNDEYFFYYMLYSYIAYLYDKKTNQPNHQLQIREILLLIFIFRGTIPT